MLLKPINAKLLFSVPILSSSSDLENLVNRMCASHEAYCQLLSVWKLVFSTWYLRDYQMETQWAVQIKKSELNMSYLSTQKWKTRIWRYESCKCKGKYSRHLMENYKKGKWVAWQWSIASCLIFQRMVSSTTWYFEKMPLEWTDLQ